MPSFELLTAFFITTALFAYIPGPAMLYAAAQTMARGRFAGLMAVLGIHVGCYFHIFASAAGLSVQRNRQNQSRIPRPEWTAEPDGRRWQSGYDPRYRFRRSLPRYARL